MYDEEFMDTETNSDHGTQDNGLMTEESPFGLEKVYDYEPGGHHPVHLGDVLHQRYRVIHKLGSGGYAIVWLCIDLSSSAPSYVAAKVITAEGSTKECPELRACKLKELSAGKPVGSGLFCLPLDQFDIQGPNGTHYAFVYPVLGPRVSRLLHIAKYKDPGGPLRRICRETTEAMAFLHSISICHGDFRPANILARLSGLDGRPEDEVLEVFGKPETTKLVTRTGANHSMSTAPQYLVYPIDWNRVLSSPKGATLVSDAACVIDFGESFEMSAPTPDLGIPQVYCSPEYCLDGLVGIGSDIWALGCTLFEIRTGRKLFDTFDDDKDEYLWKVAMMLGKFPEPWWSDTWESRRDYFGDETDADGRVIQVSHDSDDESDSPMEGGQNNGEQHVVHYQKPESRSLEDALRGGLFYEYGDRPGGIEREISEREIVVFADLLAKLLTYPPEDRLSAEKALEHEWFKFSESEAV